MTADVSWLTVGRRVLRVATRDGDPGRPPLLLCNGIGGRLELFQPFVDALDPRRGVIRFDMPGIGGSPAPVVPYHLAGLAPLLAGLLDGLGVARADVLGISWGGGLAQQFALSRPDRVHRLVLVATGPGALMVPGHPRTLLRMLTPRRHRDPGHAARIAAELYGGSLREDPALARELLHAPARPGPARGYYYQLLSGLGWTSLPRLRKLRPPTLILAGDDDPIIPLVNARIMDRLIPHSQLHVYHGGHLELGVGAGRLAPVVEAFLDAPHRRWQAELNSQGLFALQLLYVTLGNSMHIGRVTGFNVIRSMNQGEGEMHTVADLGAGERDRTADLPFTRTTTQCTVRASCNDGTRHRTDGTRCAGIIRRGVPRTVSRERPGNGPWP
jgi:poly(3-hydroxyalkanoate) depolymerase